MMHHLSSILGKIFFIILRKKAKAKLCILSIDKKTARDNRSRAAKKVPSDVEGTDAGIVFHPGSGIGGVSAIVEFSPFLEHFGVGEDVSAFTILIVVSFHSFHFLSFFVSLL
jgi:hypothetical protein